MVWQVYCKTCDEYYQEHWLVCPYCGNKLRQPGDR